MTRAAADRLLVERLIAHRANPDGVPLYKDCTGTWRKVQILDVRLKMSTVTYLNNDRRGTTYYAGRRYNHATRVTECVYNQYLVLKPSSSSTVEQQKESVQCPTS